MECSFLLACETNARPPLYQTICPSAELFFPLIFSQILFRVRFAHYVSNYIQIVKSICLYSMHHTMRPYYIVLYQCQLICLFFCLDRLQHHNMKWCWQCTSLFFHRLLQLLMVCILRVYIAQKMRGGKNSMCHKKYQNPVSHLRLGPIHISRVWYT